MNNKYQQLALLQQELRLMHRAAQAVERSWEACEEIHQTPSYALEEMDCLELLSSRFSRLVDFMIQRIFRLIDEIDLEEMGTVRDRIHRAEKKGLIIAADPFIEARLLRNKIAHEYVEAVMKEIFQEAMRLVPLLLDAVHRVDNYVLRYQLD